MAVFTSITPPAPFDGVAYSNALIMPGLEGDLVNVTPATPISIRWGEAVLAAVEFTLTGNPASNSTYVVMQTELGDGVWFDVAWCLFTALTAQTANFLLSAGVAGANSVQQTRAVGTAPAGNGSIQVPLGGRVRFVGKSSLTAAGSPSPSPGPGALQVTVSIRAKLLGLR